MRRFKALYQLLQTYGWIKLICNSGTLSGDSEMRFCNYYGKDDMGAYLNPGNQSFQMAINSEIYVDKTEMIQYLNGLINTQQRFVSVSRPRRFGKTMAADMLCAYYDREADSREIFEKRKLAECGAVQTSETDFHWDKYLGKFDVIRLVMTDFMEGSDSVQEMLDYLTEEVTAELMEAEPDIHFGNRIRLRTVMNKIYGKTGRQYVIVIDEWDAVFRTWQKDEKGQTKYLDFLRDWLKDKPYIAMAYMTGILPIKKYGKHSALNMFTEYSMMFPRQLAQYSGFTENEVQTLCRRYGRDYNKAKDWYDGYDVSDVIPPDPDHRELRETGKSPEADRYRLYSPLSVVEAMTTGAIKDYWNNTETYEALAEYIRKDYDGLKEAVALLMDGGRLAVDTSTYQNDMTTFHGRDDVLSLLIHLGYLGYNDEMSEVFIPNREILDEFKASTKTEEWADTFRSFELSQEILRATWEQKADKVAALLEKAHNQAANRTYHDEAALSYAIQLAYFAARKYYTMIPELDSGKGYVDIAYLPSPKYPDKPALVVELKYNKTADTALEQIRRQEYPDRLAHYKGNILLVGIDYDREIPSTDIEFKRHTCRIEEA